ncbi:MAG: hypothetical protein P8L66_08890 [Rhodospirillaceae bacterium]|nr:hypothetical protein [Rhodospirillaceae bacterium]
MTNRILSVIFMCASSPVLAISDDANPWLAIENATCVAHRTIDYQSLVGVPVEVEKAEWTGASNGLPTHCRVAGQVGGDSFKFRLPINWNGTLSLGDCATPHSQGALNQGAATVFGLVSAQTAVLLSAVAARHYGSPITQQVWAACH